MWGTCGECMGNVWGIFGKYIGIMWLNCGEHMETWRNMTFTMNVQGESYYETLVMCNYAIAGNMQGEK